MMFIHDMYNGCVYVYEMQPQTSFYSAVAPEQGNVERE